MASLKDLILSQFVSGAQGQFLPTATLGTTVQPFLALDKTPGTYTKVTIDSKGIVTTGDTLVSADLPTYTGSVTSTQVTSALGYTPPQPTGTGASGTWAIDISGNAATATNATTVTNGVYLTTAQTLTNKTLTAPVTNDGTFNTAFLNNAKMNVSREVITIAASAATGTIPFDAVTQAVLYYTSNATANWTLNIRGNASTTLNSLLATGESLSVVFMATTGTTAFYPTALQIDGTSVTPRWQGGSAPTSGNTSSIDVYTYTIIKTANATFTALAAQTQFK